VIVYVLMLCSFAVATTEFVLVGLLPEIAADLSVSVPAAGLLVTVYMAVVTVGGPAATAWTRRLPRRGVLVATMAIAFGSAVVSALAHTYGVLLAARSGSALAQALFMAVASQIAMAAVPPDRQTAAVAKVFNGFALATVIGLPVGSLVGHAYGWHATFVLVAVLCAAGLAGVLAFCPVVPVHDSGSLYRDLRSLYRPAILLGLLTTLLALTGFVTVFTYVGPVLREVTGLRPGWASAAFLVYGLGTVAGSALAGRVRPPAIARTLPVPLAVLAAVMVAQGATMRYPGPAVVSLFVMGVAAFVVVPLVQTWLMIHAGTSAAGLVASVNISVAGLAGALGAGLGAEVISAGPGLGLLGPVAAVPVLVATATALAIRSRRERPDGLPTDAPAVPGGVPTGGR
jgi:DHA1 family inner membrane transport protein